MLHNRIELFLSSLNRKKPTIKTYRWALNKFIAVVGEDAELTIEIYQEFLAGVRNYSPSTQGIFRSAVMGLYDFYEKADLTKMKRLNKIYTEPVKFELVNIVRNDIEKLLKYCENMRKDVIELRDRAFIFLLADSGLRIHEACNLKRGDIDRMEARTILTGKGGKMAVVRFSKRSLQAIDDYLTYSVRAELDGSSGRPLKTLPLFAQHGRSNETKSITPGGMWKSFKKRCKTIGVDIHPHELRHYFVTMVMLAKGMKTAQDLARHRSIGTTQRYAHLSEDELDRDYEEVFNVD